MDLDLGRIHVAARAAVAHAIVTQIGVRYGI